MTIIFKTTASQKSKMKNGKYVFINDFLDFMYTNEVQAIIFGKVKNGFFIESGKEHTPLKRTSKMSNKKFAHKKFLNKLENNEKHDRIPVSLMLSEYTNFTKNNFSLPLSHCSLDIMREPEEVKLDDDKYGFVDKYGTDIEVSSTIVDNKKLILFNNKIKKIQFMTNGGRGWKECIPKEEDNVNLDATFCLTQDKAKELIRKLNYFLKNHMLKIGSVSRRGFVSENESDAFGKTYSLQESSSVPCLWLGLTEYKPSISGKELSEKEVISKVMPFYELSEINSVVSGDRMHLSKNKIRTLISILNQLLK